MGRQTGRRNTSGKRSAPPSPLVREGYRLHSRHRLKRVAKKEAQRLERKGKETQVVPWTTGKYWVYKRTPGKPWKPKRSRRPRRRR